MSGTDAELTEAEAGFLVAKTLVSRATIPLSGSMWASPASDENSLKKALGARKFNNTPNHLLPGAKSSNNLSTGSHGFRKSNNWRSTKPAQANFILDNQRAVKSNDTMAPHIKPSGWVPPHMRGIDDESTSKKEDCTVVTTTSVTASSTSSQGISHPDRVDGKSSTNLFANVDPTMSAITRSLSPETKPFDPIRPSTPINNSSSSSDPHAPESTSVKSRSLSPEAKEFLPSDTTSMDFYMPEYKISATTKKLQDIANQVTRAIPAAHPTTEITMEGQKSSRWVRPAGWIPPHLRGLEDETSKKAEHSQETATPEFEKGSEASYIIKEEDEKSRYARAEDCMEPAGTNQGCVDSHIKSLDIGVVAKREKASSILNQEHDKDESINQHKKLQGWVRPPGYIPPHLRGLDVIVDLKDKTPQVITKQQEDSSTVNKKEQKPQVPVDIHNQDLNYEANKKPIELPDTDSQIEEQIPNASQSDKSRSFYKPPHTRGVESALRKPDDAQASPAHSDHSQYIQKEEKITQAVQAQVTQTPEPEDATQTQRNNSLSNLEVGHTQYNQPEYIPPHMHGLELDVTESQQAQTAEVKPRKTNSNDALSIHNEPTPIPTHMCESEHDGTKPHEDLSKDIKPEAGLPARMSENVGSDNILPHKRPGYIPPHLRILEPKVATSQAGPSRNVKLQTLEKCHSSKTVSEHNPTSSPQEQKAVTTHQAGNPSHLQGMDGAYSPQAQVAGPEIKSSTPPEFAQVTHANNRSPPTANSPSLRPHCSTYVPPHLRSLESTISTPSKTAPDTANQSSQGFEIDKQLSNEKWQFPQESESQRHNHALLGSLQKQSTATPQSIAMPDIAQNSKLSAASDVERVSDGDINFEERPSYDQSRPKENVRAKQGADPVTYLLDFDGKNWTPPPLDWQYERDSFSPAYMPEYCKEWVNSTPIFPTVEIIQRGKISDLPVFNHRLDEAPVHPECVPDLVHCEDDDKRQHQTADIESRRMMKRIEKRLREQKRREAKANSNTTIATPYQIAQMAAYAAEPVENIHAPKIDIYLRPATEKDIQGILVVYNHYVNNTIVPEDHEVLDHYAVAQLLQCLKEHKLPIVVAIEGRLPSPVQRGGKGKEQTILPQYEKVIGFAFADARGYSYGGKYNGRSRFSTNLQLYVHPRYTSKGVGRCLMDRLLQCLTIAYAGRDGYDWINPDNDTSYYNGGVRLFHQLIIEYPVEPENDSNLAWMETFLKKWYFIQAGRLRAVARSRPLQHGQSAKWLDVVFFQLEASHGNCFGPYE